LQGKSISSTSSARREKSGLEGGDGAPRPPEEEASGFSEGEIEEDGMDVGGKMTRDQYIG
jgi:hypothetical protein